MTDNRGEDDEAHPPARGELVTDIQAVVADLPDRDARSAEEILGYNESGLPG